MLLRATFVCCVALAQAHAVPCLHNAKLISQINNQALIIKNHQALIKRQAQTIERLSRGRALVLAAQILHMQIGKQPKHSARCSHLFRYTNINLLAASEELDQLIDARNAVSHPCCPDALRTEAIELLALLGTSNNSLSKEEQLALQVLASFIDRNNGQGEG